jgi:hypothetical protein
MLAIADRPKVPPVGRARELREHARRERARALSLIPRDEAPLTRANLKAIREADRQMAVVLALRLRVAAAAKDPRIVISRAEREAALSAMTEAKRRLMEVEADLAARTQARYGARVNIETKALEELRGEVVARQLVHIAAWKRHEGGRLVLERGLPVLVFEDALPNRVVTRDGLETLATLRPDYKRRVLPITALHYTAGLRFRELYEKCDPERALRPPAIDPDARGGIHHGGDNWEEKRHAIADEVAEIVRKVRAAAIAHRRCPDTWARILTEVAGKGTPISACVSGTNARRRWRAAIEPILDVVADHFGMS